MQLLLPHLEEYSRKKRKSCAVPLLYWQTGQQLTSSCVPTHKSREEISIKLEQATKPRVTGWYSYCRSNQYRDENDKLLQNTGKCYQKISNLIKNKCLYKKSTTHTARNLSLKELSQDWNFNKKDKTNQYFLLIILYCQISQHQR